jgi:hypothetical protein
VVGELWLGPAAIAFQPDTAKRPPRSPLGGEGRKDGGFWFMLVAEPAPEQKDGRMVQHIIGDDGHPVIDHARAF